MTTQDKRRNSLGFTLVELLIVIIIIAILAATGITFYNSAIKSARDAKRMDDLRNIQTALQTYHYINGRYPETPAGWVTSGSSSDPWIPGLGPQYIVKLPVDPRQQNGSCHPRDSVNCFSYAYYSYTWCDLNGAGDGYILTTRLEAHPASDLSQQRYYFGNGSFCSNWSESPINGLYVVRHP